MSSLSAARKSLAEISVTQDMFYSYFLTRCSEFRIRKPNQWILAMLENFDQTEEQEEEASSSSSSPAAVDAADKVDAAKSIAADNARPEDQSVLQQVAEKITAENKNNSENNNDNAPKYPIEVEPTPLNERRQTRVTLTKQESRKNVLLYPSIEDKVPFADKTSLVVPPTVILGNTTLSILIEMFYFMPKLERVDLSNCRLYDVDPQRIAPTGNEVIRSLLDWVCVHPSVSEIDFGSRGPNQIGTEVGSWLIRAALENPKLIAVNFDERGIEKHILDDIYRTLKINRQTQSPISTAIRSIHPISPDLLKRMQSMAEIGAIDRKTSDERQLILSLLYDRSKLFLPLLESGEAQTQFVAPARQFLLSEGVQNSNLNGVRGDGKNLFVIAAGALTIKLGRFDVRLSRGDIFGEKIGDLLFASGLISKRSANGSFFTIPHSVCGPLFSVWEKRVDRFMPFLKKNPILNALPSYLLARCCYDAELVTISNNNNSNSNTDDVVVQTGAEEQQTGQSSRPISASSQQNPKRIIKSGDVFSGFYVVVKGNFRARQHKHVAKFMETREKARAMRDGGILDFDEGSLFGEEALVNRRKTSSVDIDCSGAFSSLSEGTTDEQKSVNNNNENEEWQLIRLDKTLCSTVILPLLETVLVIQAKTYGSEWNSEEEQLRRKNEAATSSKKEDVEEENSKLSEDQQ